jgi:hypothetical protein
MSRSLEVQHLGKLMRRHALAYQTSQDEAAVAAFNDDPSSARKLLAAAAKSTISKERRGLYNAAATAGTAAKAEFRHAGRLWKDVPRLAPETVHRRR